MTSRSRRTAFVEISIISDRPGRTFSQVVDDQERTKRGKRAENESTVTPTGGFSNDRMAADPSDDSFYLSPPAADSSSPPTSISLPTFPCFNNYKSSKSFPKNFQKTMDIGTITVSRLFAMYTSNLLWSLFLTSTAIHAVALITSPIQAVHKWVRRQSSDSDTPIPYLCAVIGSSLWLRYSMFLQDTKLILLQTYAVFMQASFVAMLVFYRSKKTQRRLLRVVSLIILGLFSLFYYIQRLNEDDGKELTGRIASGAQIAGSLVCPYLIYKAVTSGCIDFVPLAPVVFTWFMEFHAIVYSIGIDDFYMLLANTIFFCMDGSLLSMFFIFPTEKKA
ncbi:unnamed protein product [Caenorhabditis auriculariae]|uniref:Sugar transporter SWEET1 n=1 Tax=Caenorhabditis auriculariae TaxID=2777116 RepID=A0A8S1H863_9PELO|nr:unnamed protein product [Caenorhabditis auriculariae]